MSQISSPSGSSYGVVYTWVQGDTVNDPFTATLPSGTAINITGYTFWLTIKSSYYSPDAQAILQLSPVITNAAAGIFAVQATKTQTLALSPGNYIFDLIMIDSASNETTLMNGSLVVLPRVTLSH